MDKDNMPLISVVIPIYNVERYLEKCIDSVVNQTYRNLQIILVDDGSPDNCGNICDEYKKKDDRIIVIHQKNRGLSGARSAGQDIALGKYITFIDSDDWISNDMIERLYNDIVSAEADISVTAFAITTENGEVLKSGKSYKYMELSNIQALELMLFNDYLNPTVCGKLWLRELWDGIYCPEGKLFEDQYTTYKLFDRATKIVFNSEPLYYYRKRQGSIGHSKFDERTYDLHYAINEEYDYITKKYPEITDSMVVAKIMWEMVFVNMMIRSKHNDNELVKKIRLFARQNLDLVNKSTYISKLRKFQINLFAKNFLIYKEFYFVYKIKHNLS